MKARAAEITHSGIQEGKKSRRLQITKAGNLESEKSQMSAKRPAIGLMALTSEQAAPMPEALQRHAPAAPPSAPPAPAPSLRAGPRVVREQALVKPENLEGLAFKASPVFRKRFRGRAVTADLKLNELLFEALDAWEEKRGLKKWFTR